MVELIDALLIGAYLGGKSVNRKMKIAECNRLRDTHDAAVEKFTDSSLESKMYNRFRNECDAIIQNEVFHDALKYIFGENWKDLYDKERGFKVYHTGMYRSGTHNFQSIRDVIFHVWLSQHGIISTVHANGYNIGLPIDNIEFGQTTNVAKRACFVIQSNVAARHPGEAVYLLKEVPQQDPCRFNNNLIWNFHAAWFPKTKTAPVCW